MSNYIESLYIVPILIFSVVVHEMAHGWVALKCGDTTARDMGRLTLNPLPHIDFFGSILVPLFSILATGRVLIAWAKPVPVDPRNFGNFRRDDTLVTAAGPVSNFAMALACSFMVIIIHTINTSAAPAADSFFFQALHILFSMFSYGIFLNVALAIFNLLPIPPLDGSHIFANMLPAEAAFRFRQIGFFGIFIILALFNYVPGFTKIFLNIIALFTLPYLKLIGIFIPEFSRMYLN